MRGQRWRNGICTGKSTQAVNCLFVSGDLAAAQCGDDECVMNEAARTLEGAIHSAAASLRVAMVHRVQRAVK